MAIDLNKPAVGDNHATEYTPGIRDALRAVAKMLEGETVNNAIVGIKQYSAGNQRFEFWNGTSWAELPLGFVKTSQYTAADVLAKLLTVDGAGTGVDADLLDGQQGSFYADIPARLGYTPANRAGDTFSGDITTYRTGAPTTGVVYLGNTGLRYVYYDGANYQMPGAALFVAGSQVWTAASLNPALYAPLASPNFSGSPALSGEALGFRRIPRTTDTTLNADKSGRCIALTAGVTIPASVYAAGDALSLYNDSAAAITLTQGGGLTLRQAGTANTGNRTLAARGMVTVWFNSATEAIISGAGLS